jgi:serine/threonine protein phosphatase 1
VLHTVFLGDYINKGQRSAEVLDELIARRDAGTATLLAGNHETTLLDALDRKDLSAFIKMGGAMTIRSYVGDTVQPGVLADLLRSVPPAHLAALRSMPLKYENDEVVARHIPSTRSTAKFRISAHVPVGDRPRIRAHSAQLDTGCGAEQGRLTALLWPSLDYLQVDHEGRTIAD